MGESQDLSGLGAVLYVAWNISERICWGVAISIELGPRLTCGLHPTLAVYEPAQFETCLGILLVAVLYADQYERIRWSNLLLITYKSIDESHRCTHQQPRRDSILLTFTRSALN